MNTAARTPKTLARNRDFLVIFYLSYPLFLVAALAERLVPRRRATAALHRQRSVFAEASATAYRTLPYAF